MGKSTSIAKALFRHIFEREFSRPTDGPFSHIAYREPNSGNRDRIFRMVMEILQVDAGEHGFRFTYDQLMAMEYSRLLEVKEYVDDYLEKRGPELAAIAARLKQSGTPKGKS